MKVVVVASGDLDPDDANALDGADLVIAADGGAVTLDRVGRRPDVLVGDLDSTDGALEERLVAAGTRIDRLPSDKDASDTELAIAEAIAAGADRILLLGALGGDRLDHALANLLLLADPSLAGHDIRLVHRRATARVVRSGQRAAIEGPAGELVSLLPIGGDVTGVATSGLRWPLEAATLRLGRSRGLSNEVVASPASVSVGTGTLLLVENEHRGTAP